jgi:hypothetical protein
MVAISKLIASIALFSTSAFAVPLENRQFPNLTCLLDPAVTAALTCVTGCLSDPTNLVSCALGCIEDLTTTEIVSRFVYSPKAR